MTDTLADVRPDANELVLDRHLAAAPAALWRCWTEPALIERWFTPAPWTTHDVELDLRPGGAFAMTMRGPEGEAHHNAGVYLEVVPHRGWSSPTPTSPPGRPRRSRSSPASSPSRPRAAARATSPARGTGPPRTAPSTRRWASTKAGARPPTSWRRSRAASDPVSTNSIRPKVRPKEGVRPRRVHACTAPDQVLIQDLVMEKLRTRLTGVTSGRRQRRLAASVGSAWMCRPPLTGRGTARRGAAPATSALTGPGAGALLRARRPAGPPRNRGGKPRLSGRTSVKPIASGRRCARFAASEARHGQRPEPRRRGAQRDRPRRREPPRRVQGLRRAWRRRGAARRAPASTRRWRRS